MGKTKRALRIERNHGEPLAWWAQKVEEKGWLTSNELHSWIHPYNYVLSFVPSEVGVPHLQWNESTRWYLDGRVKAGRQWVGRWYVDVTRERHSWPRSDEAGAKRLGIHPYRAFDPVFLLTWLKKTRAFVTTHQDPKYDALSDKIKAMFPKGQLILCNPRARDDGPNGTTYYDTVRVPNQTDRRDSRYGLSYGAESDSDWPTEPLQRLAKLKDLEHMELGSAVVHENRRRTQAWQKLGAVTGMLETAIQRHLPYPYAADDLLYLTDPVREVRVLDHLFYYSRKERRGWERVLTIVDGERDKMQPINLQQAVQP
jgi:hypothetical protein